MTFIVALQAVDSVILSADNIMVKFCDGNDEMPKAIEANKIHLWEAGFFTGTGDYSVIYRMRRYLAKPKDIALLPSVLASEKTKRVREVGQHEQIANTRLIISSNTSDGPRLYVVDNHSVQRVGCGELLIFFPLDYAFLINSEKKIRALNAAIRSYVSFESRQAWCDFYMAHFSSIYAIQHKHNKQISSSFHIGFQSKQWKQIDFVTNSSDA